VQHATTEIIVCRGHVGASSYSLPAASNRHWHRSWRRLRSAYFMLKKIDVLSPVLQRKFLRYRTCQGIIHGGRIVVVHQYKLASGQDLYVYAVKISKRTRI
jgi:hypothetical protein